MCEDCKIKELRQKILNTAMKTRSWKKSELIAQITMEYKAVLETLTIKQLNEVLTDLENNKIN